ncbi:MAG TPA: hypothetical protein VHC97_26945 [Thermoanaerobaculia bacterium]|nr:hypothetical protein [Thermoanaerobaculia bacterium]
MSSRWIARVGMVLMLGLLMAATAQATALSTALDVQGQGLTIAEGAVGLQGIGAGSATLSVNVGGPVQAALLYWAGRDRPCPQSGGNCIIPSQPYKDQVLRFDGNLITGTIIGTEGQPVSAGGPINNIGFLADVTNIVKAKGTGALSFSIADGDLTSNLFRLNGATLLVIFTDPSDSATYRLMVFDGLDFAYGDDPTPGDNRVTAPVVFMHGASPNARQAQLLLVLGDAEAGRPDRIDISNNPSLVNTLVGADGISWDSGFTPINIPGGAGSTTVQTFSEPVGQNPDSLLWILTALRVPLPGEPQELPPGNEPGNEGCTPGYWKNHTGSWAASGYSPSQTVVSVFSGASAFPSLASQTLLQALQGGGGPGTLGAAKILLRAATAALLNAAHPGVDYPRISTQIISDVNAALASNNRDAMLALATALDNDNNGGCPLS